MILMNKIATAFTEAWQKGGNQYAAVKSIQSTGGNAQATSFYQLQTTVGAFFCKQASVTKFPQLLACETEGLDYLSVKGGLPVPTPQLYIDKEGEQYLFTKWITLTQGTTTGWSKAGEALAKLHWQTADVFGWATTNYVGTLPQQNNFANNWTDFFIAQRLQPLVNQAVAKNLITAKDASLFQTLYGQLPQLFNPHQKPLLLHGDLWSGNLLFNEIDEPFFIDPALYYGHPAMDIGMTHLFGSFPVAFYDAYRSNAPQQVTADEIQLCNLYPLLVHLILFGRSYLPRIQNTLRHFT